MEKYIAYYRVSTVKQGVSGLGLESQRAIIKSFLKHKNVELCGEFTEVESGRVNNRVELQKALKVTKDAGGTLVIAKLDRLSRNVSFISSLMESKVKFVCCDLPEANEFTINIFASLAQQERKMISERTKNALLAKRIREPNYKHGRNNLTKEIIQRAHDTIRFNARNDITVRHAYHYIHTLKEAGHTYQEMANFLNEQGYLTRTGKSFHAQQIWNIVKRMEDKS